MRGITIGPIENALHPGKGYGSPAYERMLDEARRLGANWVSITPFGRVANLTPTGIDMTFEAPYPENRVAVAKAIRQAHEAGLRVMLVPHLWVEDGAGAPKSSLETTQPGRAGRPPIAASCKAGPK